MAKKIRWNFFLSNNANFKICYFIFLSLNMIQFINVSIFSRLFLAMFSIWGLFFLLKQIFIQKFRSLNKTNIIWPICMLFTCFLSYLWNWDGQGLHNIFLLYYYILCVIILYTPNLADKNNRELITISKSYTVLSAITATICICMFFLQTQIQIIGRSGSIMHIGMWENRLFGVFSSPNVGGTFFFIGIVLSIYLLYLIKYFKINRKWKYLCGVNVFMSMWYIALSLSRGTYLSLLLTYVITFILYKIPQKDLSLSHHKRMPKFLLFCLISVGVLASSFFLKECSLAIVNKCTQNDLVLERIEYRQTSELALEQSFEPEPKAQIDISNKRLGIWKASIKLVMSSPFLGVGNSYIKLQQLSNTEKAKYSINEINMINWSAGNIHNGYLQILVSCGIFSLFFYVIFLLLCFINVCNFFKHEQNIHTRNQCILSFSIVLYLLINNLFETNMALMGTNSFQAAFWIFSGYVITYCKVYKEKNRL